MVGEWVTQREDIFTKLELVNFTESSPWYWQFGRLWWEAVDSWFGFKVNFLRQKQFHGVLACSDRSRDRCNIWIPDEMDMTPLRVSYWRGFYHRLIVNEYSFNYICTRWSDRHEGHGCHTPVPPFLLPEWESCNQSIRRPTHAICWNDIAYSSMLGPFKWFSTWIRRIYLLSNWRYIEFGKV